MPSEGTSQAVLVSIVSFEDEEFLERCLASVQNQSHPCRVKVWDNASQDRSRQIARDFGAELAASRSNLGFAAGHNRNLQDEDFEFALILNPDVVLRHDYLARLVQALRQFPGFGMAGGKLLRMDASGRSILSRGFPLIDSTGIYFTPSLRHFDRGNGEEDRGQYQRPQWVFGLTGAAVLLRHTMLEELGFGREVFDEDFFAYREDADLSWRALLRGWKAIYVPEAEALHYRKVLPSRRRQLSRLINYHSVKNRYLMRLKNMDSAVRRRCFPYAYLRDLGIFVYVILLEWGSIPAFREVWTLRNRYREKRQVVQGGRRRAPAEVAAWFSFEPQARDLESEPGEQT